MRNNDSSRWQLAGSEDATNNVEKGFPRHIKIHCGKVKCHIPHQIPSLISSFPEFPVLCSDTKIYRHTWKKKSTN